MIENAERSNIPKDLNDLTPMEQKFLLLYRQLDKVKQDEISSQLTFFINESYELDLDNKACRLHFKNN